MRKFKGWDGFSPRRRHGHSTTQLTPLMRLVYRVCDIEAFEQEVIQSTAEQQISAS